MFKTFVPRKKEILLIVIQYLKGYENFLHGLLFIATVLWIRIGFDADPDPAFLVNADPDPYPEF